MGPLIIRPRRGTLSECEKSDYVPKYREILVVKETLSEMEPSFKLGDGKHKFNELPYVSMDYAFKHGCIYPVGFTQFPYVIIDCTGYTEEGE